MTDLTSMFLLSLPFVLIGLVITVAGLWCLVVVRPRQRARGQRTVDAMGTVVNHQRRRRPRNLGGAGAGSRGSTNGWDGTS